MSCLSSDAIEVTITASARGIEYLKEYEIKTWHLSFTVTILSIVATYFTIAELKVVA